MSLARNNWARYCVRIAQGRYHCTNVLVGTKIASQRIELSHKRWLREMYNPGLRYRHEIAATQIRPCNHYKIIYFINIIIPRQDRYNHQRTMQYTKCKRSQRESQYNIILIITERNYITATG